jgi:putative oxidoreductase
MKQDRLMDAGLLVIRIMLAVVFIYHGGQKLFGGLDGFAGHLGNMGVPAPQVAAFLAALSEFGGGLVLLAGVAFRWTLPFLVFTMLVAYFKGHGGNFSAQAGGGEYALTLGLVVLGLILTGPGAFGLTGLLGRKKEA